MDAHPAPATIDDVRLAIFRQHTSLAQLIDELETRANEVLAGSSERKGLCDALEILTTRLARHLEYEETHLPKWLPTAAEFFSDHEEQRERMKGLAHDRAVFADPRTLAREVLTFIHQLRKEIAREDSALRAIA